MRRFALLAWLRVCTALTIVSAFYLTLYYVTLPGEMPFWLDQTVRLGFRIFLHNDIPDPDTDIAEVPLLFYFACAIVLVGSIVGIAATMTWRRALSPRLRRL
ncbi:hypothetical protein [Paraburkholderia phenazinium]|jgi:hypothetical protein|uniref:Uncharacterized protein n=1 Tax=Paraburkholderia phenazinium TaxID=60549 RepID=A0A1G8DFF0_9BURK|nr:hypothetical protein [Paraburkholderia phenazinium]SDH56169.1 hypothetical protein SAMN05216466_1112 [Paraburkholderia phenazinium]